MKLVCSARIENEQERRAIMSWVRVVANGGFSELGDKVSLTYIGNNEDPENSSRWWGIIHVFEQYPEHTIEHSES